MREYLLNNGVGIPVLGFGTWKAQDGEEAYQATLAALKAGYRHIDTAAIYKNEESVGRAIKDSSLSRPSSGMTFILMRRLKRPLLPQWSGWDWTIWTSTSSTGLIPNP